LQVLVFCFYLHFMILIGELYLVVGHIYLRQMYQNQNVLSKIVKTRKSMFSYLLMHYFGPQFLLNTYLMPYWQSLELSLL